VSHITVEQGLTLTQPVCPVRSGSHLEYEAEVKGTLAIPALPRTTAIILIIQTDNHQPFTQRIPVLVMPSWSSIASWAFAGIFALLVWRRYTEMVSATRDPWVAVWEVIADWRFLGSVSIFAITAVLLARVVGLGWLVIGEEEPG